MNKIRKSVSFLLAVVFCISVGGYNCYASQIGDALDEGISWTLDTESGALNVSGTGDISNRVKSPWLNYSDYVSSVIIGSGIEKIGECAFANMANIEKIEFSDTVTTLAGNSFSGCTSLNNIQLPSALLSLSDSAFAGCSGLENFYISSANQNFNVDDGVLYSKDGTSLVRYPAANTAIEFVVPSSVETICAYVFDSASNLESITVNSACKQICSNAFSDCSAEKIIILCDECEIDENADIPESATVYCSKNSAVAEYLDDNNINFEYNESSEHHTHSFESTTTAPTCTQQGSTIYKCKGCDYTVESDYKVAYGHTFTQTLKKAGYKTSGKKSTVCSKCGFVSSSKTIHAVTVLSLSKTTYTYNGKTKKPSVTVKDSEGNTISSSYYTVSYGSGRKNVGKYAVKITFKGNYSGSKTLYFTIKPKGTSISKLSKGKKKFTVKWKKQKTQTTGYQI